MAAPQDALAARAGSSEMEFLVRSCSRRRRVCLGGGEAQAMLPCVCSGRLLWDIDWVGAC